MTEYLDLFSVAGAIGVIFYLSSYFMLQAGFVHGTGYAYAGMNLLGASLVLVSLARDFNIFSVIIQVCWIVISIFGLIRVIMRNREIRFTPEEEELIAGKFPRMSRFHAKSLLRCGQWIDIENPLPLIEEGQPSPALFYLAKGEAIITADGLDVARATPASFLGEVTVLSDEAATASVTALPGARLVRFAREPLRRIVESDPEFRASLDAALNSETRAKLVALNKRLTTAAPSG